MTTQQASKTQTNQASNIQSKPKPQPKPQVSQSQVQSSCIDINSASESELIEIKHISEARAKDLINNRPYQSLDELNKVKGIAEKRLEEIKAEGKACVK